jgi:hypothetical protein
MIPYRLFAKYVWGPAVDPADVLKELSNKVGAQVPQKIFDNAIPMLMETIFWTSPDYLKREKAYPRPGYDAAYAKFAKFAHEKGENLFTPSRFVARIMLALEERESNGEMHRHGVVAHDYMVRLFTAMIPYMFRLPFRQKYASKPSDADPYLDRSFSFVFQCKDALGASVDDLYADDAKIHLTCLTKRSKDSLALEREMLAYDRPGVCLADCFIHPGVDLYHDDNIPARETLKFTVYMYHTLSRKECAGLIKELLTRLGATACTTRQFGFSLACIFTIPSSS